jgi:hypothetical protein
VLLEWYVDALISPSGARISQNVGPPSLACRLLGMQPPSSANRLARLQHGSEQVSYLRPAGIQQDEIWH